MSQLEDQLKKLPDYERTLHYELKEEGILSFNLMRDGFITISYLEQIKDKWRVLDGVGVLDPREYSYLITANTKMPFRMTAITTHDPEVEHIRIRGEEAKLIQRDDIRLWISFIDENIHAADIKAYNIANQVIELQPQ